LAVVLLNWAQAPVVSPAVGAGIVAAVSAVAVAVEVSENPAMDEISLYNAQINLPAGIV
jgi:hypothetical protein